jgi:predicted transcriptional regulator
MSGWIKLHRKLLNWEWYSKPVVKSIFIHSLLRANHKDGKWQGKEIKRGSYISSVDKLSNELGHSRQEIRTALKHLKSTNELTTVSGSQHTVFIVVNYDSYQNETSDLTNEQPTANQRSTTNKNEKNEKNLIKVEKFDYEAVKEIFNRVMTRSPKVNKFNDKRKRAIKNLFKFAELDLKKFEAYLNFMHSNKSWDWCFEKRTGTNGVNYKECSFEFFMKEETYLKAKEEV